MSKYTTYYTSADTNVFVEAPLGNVEPIMIDTLSSVAWNESMTSGQVYGLGEQRHGFVNSGNVMINGIIELNFTDELYMKCLLNEVVGDSYKFQNMSASQAFTSNDSRLINSFVREKKKIRSTPLSSGIQTYPSGFNINVVFNNGNHYHRDVDKKILLSECKIVGTQMTSSVQVPGQLIQQFKFISREVII